MSAQCCPAVHWKRGDDTNIIAGYHWFRSWGRDTFISLPGLAVARTSEDLYAAVLDTRRCAA
ncbi:MAG: amylo-alpha-1,6-glucosidase [Bacteroidales bacterium]